MSHIFVYDTQIIPPRRSKSWQCRWEPSIATWGPLILTLHKVAVKISSSCDFWEKEVAISKILKCHVWDCWFDGRTIAAMLNHMKYGKLFLIFRSRGGIIIRSWFDYLISFDWASTCPSGNFITNNGIRKNWLRSWVNRCYVLLWEEYVQNCGTSNSCTTRSHSWKITTTSMSSFTDGFNTNLAIVTKWIGLEHRDVHGSRSAEWSVDRSLQYCLSVDTPSHGHVQTRNRPVGSLTCVCSKYFGVSTASRAG